MRTLGRYISIERANIAFDGRKLPRIERASIAFDGDKLVQLATSAASQCFERTLHGLLHRLLRRLHGILLRLPRFERASIACDVGCESVL